MKGKEYYLRAERILKKMIDTRHYIRFRTNFNRMEKLCRICIRGQKLGYIPQPIK